MLNIRKFLQGINLIPNTTSQVSAAGDIEVLSSTGKANFFNGVAGTASQVVTETHASQGTSRLLNKDLDDTTTAIVSSGDVTKKIAFSAAGNNTGIVTTVASSSTSAETITLPNATDTLVARATTDTLTNKTIAAGSNTITGLTNTNLSGSAAITGANLATNTVANSNLSQMPANTIKGNNTAGTANALDLTISQVNAMLGVSSPLTTKGDLYTYSTTNTRLPVGSDNQSLVADSSQTTGLRWTTLQQGAKNYITYNNFENNATTGWALGTVGTLTNGIPTGTPTFGSGASGNLSITTVSSGQLAGLYSLSYVSSAATTVGNMLATQAYSIDPEDQAKVLTFKFYYSPISGSSTANWSGTSSNSFGVACYDVTNSSWLPVAGNFAMTQGSGIGLATGTFQTNATTASLRFVIYNINATTGAISVNFDDFYLGPQTAPIGAPQSDWTTNYGGRPQTTAFGTLVNNYSEGRRIGDTLYVRGYFQCGTVANNSAQILLPAGLAIDSTKLTTTANAQKVGEYFSPTNSGSGTATVANTVYWNGSDTTGVYLTANGQSSVFQPLTGSALFNNSQGVSYEFSVPITGWSSNVQMSADTDTRVVAAAYYLSSSTSIGASNPINFDTKQYDTHAAVSNPGTNWQFNCPVTGYYKITLNAMLQGGSNSNVAVWKNGVTYANLIWSSGSNNVVTGAMDIQLNAGETFTIRPDATETFTGGTAPTKTALYVSRISGPAVIASTEIVAASYSSILGQSIPNATNTLMSFPTIAFDTHNAFSTSTNLYTVPVSGIYNIAAISTYNIGNLGGGTYFQTFVYKNGSVYRTLGLTNESGSVSTINSSGGSTLMQCNAGDTIGIYTFQDSTATASLYSVAGYNHFSIQRLKN